VRRPRLSAPAAAAASSAAAWPGPAAAAASSAAAWRGPASAAAWSAAARRWRRRGCAPRARQCARPAPPPAARSGRSAGPRLRRRLSQLCCAATLWPWTCQARVKSHKRHCRLSALVCSKSRAPVLHTLQSFTTKAWVRSAQGVLVTAVQVLHPPLTGVGGHCRAQAARGCAHLPARPAPRHGRGQAVGHVRHVCGARNGCVRWASAAHTQHAGGPPAQQHRTAEVI